MNAAAFSSSELAALVSAAGGSMDARRVPFTRLRAQRRRQGGHPEDRAPSRPLGTGEERVVEIDTVDELLRVAVKLRTFGSTTAGATLSLERLDDDGPTLAAEETLFPAIDDVWVELVPDHPRPGRYRLRVHGARGTIAPAPRRDEADDELAWAAEFAERRTVCVTATADALAVVAEEPDRTELVLELPWRRDGYGMAPDDRTTFDAIVSRGGRYVPVEQLRRVPAWLFTIDDTDVTFLSGEAGFGVRCERGLSVTGTMTADTMTVTVRPADGGSVELRPEASRSALVEHLPRFLASDERRAAQLTRLFRERALSCPFRDYTASTAGWKHWLTRMLSWTDTDGRDAQAADLLDTVQDREGWVWTRTDSPGWPFPDPSRYDTRHPSASLSYVAAIAIHYAWTGDEEFLEAMLPRARRALAHVLERYDVATAGLLVNSIPDQDGQAGSIGSHYWDIVPGGATDAYANILLFTAVRRFAELERHLGSDERAEQLCALARRVHSAFSAAFWHEDVGRFVQNIDSTGVVHDYGATYVNLEAAAAGLATDEQITRILDWIDAGRTELTDQLVLVPPSGTVRALTPGRPVEQRFSVGSGFRTVGAVITSSDVAASFTLELLDREGSSLAAHRFDRWWDRGWASLDAGDRPAGDYHLRVTAHGSGLGWQRGADPTGESSDDAPELLAHAVVSGHRPGAADIMSAWGFAPRATTRRNDFWYTFGWSGVETDFGEQVQDGGTAFYISAFEVESRARLDPDHAWRRVTEILDRVEAPDRLCGGAPLVNGERPQSILPGQVGVDVPFPESGLVPFSVLPAFLGLDPRPDGLVMRPALPSGLDSFGVDNVRWHGRLLTIVAGRESVTVTAAAESVTHPIIDGDVVILRPTTGGTFTLQNHSPQEGI